jgi:hypothetical protein
MNVNSHTALYSDLDIEYQQEYSGPYEDLRWETAHGIQIAGLKDGKITGFGRPMVIFGGACFQRVAIRRLWKVSQDIEYMDYLIDGNMSPVTQFLLEHGYEAVPYFTQVIDLTKSEKELKHDLRKSYKSLVEKYKEEIGVYFGIYGFRQIYKIICDGTRSNETWNIQDRMAMRDEAFSVLHYGRNAGVLFYVSGDYGYYASSKSDMNTHHLVWKAILECKKRGVKYLEMGEQVFTDDKAGNISKFKRGFGGETKTRLLVRRKDE